MSTPTTTWRWSLLRGLRPYYLGHWRCGGDTCLCLAVCDDFGNLVVVT